MKIILKKEVANLGEVLDVVEVKAGYAQNYLITHEFTKEERGLTRRLSLLLMPRLLQPRLQLHR